MTTVTHKSGDLFTSDAPALGQGVNVVGAMHAGIANVFRLRFAGMFDAYAKVCRSGALIPGGMFFWPATEELPAVYNIASQDQTGPNASLDWLETGTRAALQHADQNGITRIALPQIGCGIGGLVWEDALPVLEKVAAEYRCDLELWTYEG
ncbi:macro domain-containing protein [Leifsonia sp. Leaf264]|uniref:macro domain-containing protein n=1 Tax=Leifsonia sp. Leaf264 TaxID=1736314 RepID=UPI0007006CF2|nr:macro domain-containing protein [Leifsonia sp. Leaf264]KQO98315.1 hypothetical protein ASF30_09655 [Leifsonia sp. Leaf264]